MTHEQYNNSSSIHYIKTELQADINYRDECSSAFLNKSQNVFCCCEKCKYLHLTWYRSFAIHCTAELSLRQQEAVQGASQMFCSAHVLCDVCVICWFFWQVKHLPTLHFISVLSCFIRFQLESSACKSLGSIFSEKALT